MKMKQIFWLAMAAGLAVSGCPHDEPGVSSLYGPCGDPAGKCEPDHICMVDPSKVTSVFYCSHECWFAEEYTSDDEAEQAVGQCQTGVDVCGQGCCMVNSYQLEDGVETSGLPLDVDIVEDDGSGAKECPPGYKLFFGQCVEDPDDDPPARQCPPGFRPIYGKCVQELDDDPPATQCPPGSRLLYGKCVEEPTHTYILSGFCASHVQ